MSGGRSPRAGSWHRVRNSTRRRTGLSLIALAVLIGLLSACGSASPAASAPPKTKIVYVSPVTPAGAPAGQYRITSTATSATCIPGSEAIGQAYRCFAGNFIHDPCWPVKNAAVSVLCLAYPWSHAATRLTVKSPLAAIPSERGIGEPWGVQLADGKRCALIQGAHPVFARHVIDYYCSSSFFLLRGLDKTSLSWLAHSVTSSSGHMAIGPAEKIVLAWFGRPAR